MGIFNLSTVPMYLSFQYFYGMTANKLYDDGNGIRRILTLQVYSKVTSIDFVLLGIV